MKKIYLIILFFAAMWSCKKDEPDLIELSTTEITLNYGDEYQIEAKSKSSILYIVEDEYHGVVTLDGLIMARFVGETNVLVSNGEDLKYIKLNVVPTVNLFPEPDVNYPATTIDDLINELGMPDSINNNQAIYENYSTSATTAVFDFNIYRTVLGYGVFLKSEYNSELLTFLNERYQEIHVASSIYDKTFINNVIEEKATCIIRMIELDSRYSYVSYSFKSATK